MNQTLRVLQAAPQKIQTEIASRNLTQFFLSQKRDDLWQPSSKSTQFVTLIDSSQFKDIQKLSIFVFRLEIDTKPL